MFSYDAWANEQTAQIKTALQQWAMAGRFEGVVWFIPTDGKIAGRLELAAEKPDGATDVIRFPGVGDRVSSFPLSGLYSAIWHACRRLPLIPTESS